MKKFIAAFDGLRFSESTMSYAVFLATKCNAHLVGVFLEDFTRHSYSAADVMDYQGKAFDKHVEELNDRDRNDRDRSIEVFEMACRNAGLNHSIHRDRNVALQDLLHESIYADLLIIGSGETLTRYEEPEPTRFLRDLLNDVQCPVVVVPEKYERINKFILLYNGEPSSVYAVRAFSYLFEPFKDLDTEIVTVKAVHDSLHVPDNKLIKEFIKRHFSNPKYVVLQGFAENEILRYLGRENSHPLVVLGAYRRSRLSRLFRQSMADHLMHELNVPLFIAHNKS